jgi:hypothetical protein
MIGAKEMIEMRRMNKDYEKVQGVWCQGQVDDFNHIILMVEDLIATAVASHNSSQQYTMLQEAKRNFVTNFLEMAERYRRIQTTQ